MTSGMRGWMLWAALAGVFFGAGTAARAQNPTTEPKPGTRADRKEDKREYQALRAKIRQDEQKLRLDVRQFGKNSPQARADRQQLQLDKQEMKHLKRDVKRDRRSHQQQNQRRRRSPV